MSGLTACSSRANSTSLMPVGSTSRKSGTSPRTWLSSGSGKNSRTSVAVSTAKSEAAPDMQEREGTTGESDRRKTFEDFGEAVDWSEGYGPKTGRKEELFITIKPMALAADGRSDGPRGDDGDHGAVFILNHWPAEPGTQHTEAIGLRGADQFVLPRTGPELPLVSGLAAHARLQLGRAQRAEVENRKREID